MARNSAVHGGLPFWAQGNSALWREVADSIRSRIERLAPRSRPLLEGEVRADFSQQFRLLALTVQQLAAQQPLQTILVMGAYPGDGRTMTVAHLGMALTEIGYRVVVLDSDARNPELGQLLREEELGDEGAPTRGPLPPMAVPTRVPGLMLVPSSSLDLARRDPSVMTELLSALKAMADFIILDSPPCLRYVDAFFLARFVDGVMYVVRRRQQDAGAQHAVQSQLARLGARVLGVVYNEG